MQAAVQSGFLPRIRPRLHFSAQAVACCAQCHRKRPNQKRTEYLQLGKLIAKTAGITLAAIVALALVLLGMFSWFAPGIMVTITENLGLEGACASYSISVYERSGDIDDLAVAVERCYNVGDYENAASYGSELLSDEGFDDYCAKRDNEITSDYIGDTDQYLIGIVAESLYRTNQKENALNLVSAAANNEFRTNSAIVYLGTVAVEQGDAAFCSQILSRLDGMDLDEDLYPGLKTFREMLQEVAGE